MNRRTYIAAMGATAVGTVGLAGCSGGDPDAAGETGTGTFRLLISDQPAAIGDFDSLEVTLSSARVFRAGDDEEVTPAAVTDAVNETTATAAGNTTATGTEDGGSSGFVEFELDDVVVDLTQVVGDRAVAVLEDELEEGRYSGIELSVANAEGVVDGDTVDVMVPSNRLRIVRPFEVAPDVELGFVFDINVIKKGPTGNYNLLPVVGKSGVTGEDVDVEEVDIEDIEPAGPPDDTGGADQETNTTG